MNTPGQKTEVEVKAAHDAALQQALQHHQAGRHAEAESRYREILKAEPDHPEVLHYLGVLAHQGGNNEIAVNLISKALAIKPDYAQAYINLGVALKDLGALIEAVANYEKALAIKPDDAEAHYNLGNAFKDLGELNEAVTSYLKALAIKPGYAGAHSNLGIVLKEQGKLDEAVASYQNALAINPDHAEALCNLGIALGGLGRREEALASYHQALAINPDFAEAHCNLGNMLKESEKLEEAIECYERAITLKPDYAGAHNNLASLLNKLGKQDMAIAGFRKALAINPDFAEAQSNLLMATQYTNGITARRLNEIHSEWEGQFGAPLREDWREHKNQRDTTKRLRIGFLSPNLGKHPVGYFLVSLLENRLQDEAEFICYSDGKSDEMTERLRGASDGWIDSRGIADESLAERIRTDDIDILFDLAGHTGRNRLRVFARKPAPLQVTWAGYVGTTGLKAMDYLLSDRFYTPQEEDDLYSENIIRMPDAYVCYDPPSYAPDVGPPPVERNGFITFGSFNNLAKINDAALETWFKILKAVPDSQLILKYKGIDDISNRDRFLSPLEAHGLDASRLILEGRSPHSELLGRYNDIDIALDTFPYSGGLTTCEALWMGVPVITVPGKTFAGRHSLSHLSNIGMPELAVEDETHYVELAVELAADLPLMASLRSGLRNRMATSPLCDGPRFARHFAAEMRKIWHLWCESEG